MSTDILKSTLSLTSVLSLLAAGAIGVWTCASTLNDIRNNAEGTRRDLVEAKAEINWKLDSHAQAISAIQSRTDDLLLQNETTKVTLRQIQDQIKHQQQ